MNFSSLRLKVLTASLILASSTGIALAQGYKGEVNYKGEAPCPVLPSLLGGFYVGGQVGYDSYRVHDTLNVSDPVFGNAISGSGSTSLTGWVGGLLVGYGMYFNDFYYLGGEVEGGYSGAQNSSSLGLFGTTTTVPPTTVRVNHNTKVNARGTWGVQFVPGIKLNPTSLGYVKLGYTWTNFRAKSSGSVFSPALPAPGVLVASGSGNNNKTRGGFNFGIGIETLLCDNWSVRTEYNHTWYQNYSRSFTTDTGVTATGKFRPSDNQFLVGVLYHFA